MLEFWADRFRFAPGDVIHLYGQLYTVDSQGSWGLTGERVILVDPKSNQPWVEAITGAEGWWHFDYTVDVNYGWQTFAWHPSSGQRSGTLSFEAIDPLGNYPH